MAGQDDYVIQLGDLVWAKMKGFSPWPGKVVKPYMNKPRAKSGKDMHCVWFFGSNNFAWIEDFSIKPYEPYRDTLKTASKTLQFKEAVRCIEDYIARRDRGEDVEKEFEEMDRENEARRQEKTQKKTPSTAGSSAAGSTHDLSDESETETPPKKRRTTLTDSEGKKPKGVTPRKKKVQENGDATTPKTPRRIRQLPAKIASDMEPSSMNKSTASSRASAASILLNRPTTTGLQEASPTNMSLPSDFIKERDISPSKLRFGFIGLGNMGSGIVKNLVHSGHSVTVWNRSDSKVREFTEQLSVQSVQTPSDVVSQSDVTFSCLTDPTVCKQIVFGNCGVLSEMNADKAYVELSTIDPETSKCIADGVSSKGGRYMECQMQGSKTEADQGTLVIMAAGDRSLYDDCQSALQAICMKSYYCGEVGNAATMNIIVQMIYGVSLAALGEGLALAERASLNLNDLMEILGLTSLSSKMLKEKGKAIIDRSFGTQLPLQHIQKDLHLVLGMANVFEQPLHIASAANEVYKHARQIGYGEHDASAVVLGFKF